MSNQTIKIFIVAFEQLHGMPCCNSQNQNWCRRVKDIHRLFEQPHHAHTPCHSQQSCNEWQNQALLTAECFKVQQSNHQYGNREQNIDTLRVIFSFIQIDRITADTERHIFRLFAFYNFVDRSHHLLEALWTFLKLKQNCSSSLIFRHH